MSDHKLPAEMSEWPDDPYRLLGILPGVNPRDLKRAYTRLIRDFKPEQYPNHFSRIRAAYEAVLGHVQWMQSARESAGEPEQPQNNDDPRGSPATGSAAGGSDESDAAWFARSDRPRTVSLQEELQELWNTACKGDEAAAYRGLLRLHKQQPGDTNVCLRGYWLLVLSPQLDPKHSPCDWLAHGLVKSCLTGPLRELYRRETQDSPEEALSDRFLNLLNCPARPGLIGDMIEWRWRAAAQRPELPKLIGDDLRAFRRRILDDDEEAWARLLLWAVDHLAWDLTEAGAAARDACLAEIRALAHLESRLSGALDRLDVLVEMAAGWRLLAERQSPFPKLFALIRQSWLQPAYELKFETLAALEQVMQYFQPSLNELSVWAEQAPTLLAQFNRLLDELEMSMESELVARTQDETAAVVWDYLRICEWFKYPAWRPELAYFCTHEAISPEQIAEIVAGVVSFQYSTDQHLAQLLISDWPLRHLCRAHRLFWT